MTITSVHPREYRIGKVLWRIRTSDGARYSTENGAIARAAELASKANPPADVVLSSRTGGTSWDKELVTLQVPALGLDVSVYRD